jgi:hypothetical protein
MRQDAAHEPALPRGGDAAALDVGLDLALAFGGASGIPAAGKDRAPEVGCHGMSSGVSRILGQTPNHVNILFATPTKALYFGAAMVTFFP